MFIRVCRHAVKNHSNNKTTHPYIDYFIQKRSKGKQNRILLWKKDFRCPVFWFCYSYCRWTTTSQTISDSLRRGC
jgi:hypothetical protein